MRICPSYGAGRCQKSVENNNNVKYFLSALLCCLILGFSRVPKHLSRPPPRSSSSSPSQIFGGLTPPSVLSCLTLCPVHSEGDKNMDVFHFQSARLLSVSFSRFLGFFFPGRSKPLCPSVTLLVNVSLYRV